MRRTFLAVLACLAATTAIAGRVAIESPRAGETVVDPDGRIPVTLNSSLASGERLRVLLNGVAVEAAGQGGRLMLLNVDRGEHRLEAEVVDGNGAVVATSLPVTFTVVRVAAGSGARGAPPADATTGGAGLPRAGPVGSPSATNPPGTIGMPNPTNPPGTIGAGTPPGTPPGRGTLPGAAPGTGAASGPAPGTGNPGATVGGPAPGIR